LDVEVFRKTVYESNALQLQDNSPESLDLSCFQPISATRKKNPFLLFGLSENG
jgi:hypothetical protein